MDLRRQRRQQQGIVQVFNHPPAILSPMVDKENGTTSRLQPSVRLSGNLRTSDSPSIHGHPLRFIDPLFLNGSRS
jgi:hypothetical protein